MYRTGNNKRRISRSFYSHLQCSWSKVNIFYGYKCCRRFSVESHAKMTSCKDKYYKAPRRRLKQASIEEMDPKCMGLLFQVTLRVLVRFPACLLMFRRSSLQLFRSVRLCDVRIAGFGVNHPRDARGGNFATHGSMLGSCSLRVGWETLGPSWWVLTLRVLLQYVFSLSKSVCLLVAFGGASSAVYRLDSESMVSSRTACVRGVQYCSTAQVVTWVAGYHPASDVLATEVWGLLRRIFC